MRKSFVYLGLMQAEGDAFFVKVGKTNHPESRERAYATHCPGGLSSMHAVELKSEAEAFAVEAKLYSRMHRMAFVVPIGGEWFRVAGEGLSGVFDMLIEEAGEPFRVSVAANRMSRRVFGSN